MRNVQIDDLPDDVYQILNERAAKANQSLPDYLRAMLIADSKTRTLQEEFDRARRWTIARWRTTKPESTDRIGTTIFGGIVDD